MSVTIVEVLRRADQGMTRPFLCRGDDDVLYYVKGRGAGLRSLCCEWVAGRLAQEMKLPIPRFEIAEVPAALVAGSDREDIRELGAGRVFASARVEGAGEITWSEAMAIPGGMMAGVLLFDRWVQNEDRSLSALGGNPNLLMGPDGVRQRKLWVFDFNLAFDTDFKVERFWANHLFAELLLQWPLAFREQAEPWMQAALAKLPEIFQTMPLEWLHLDGDESLPVQLDQNLVFETLSRAFTDAASFWSRT